MPRTIQNPTHDDLDRFLFEPVEVHVDAEEAIYRGILIINTVDEGTWVIREFGSYAAVLYNDPAVREWNSIRRLEVPDLSWAEQQAWMAFEPLSAMVYVQLEASKSVSTLSF